MAIDGRFQPAVAARRAIATLTVDIAGARWRTHWCNLDDLTAAFFVLIAAAARARIISTRLQFWNCLSRACGTIARNLYNSCGLLLSMTIAIRFDQADSYSKTELSQS